MKKLYTLFFSLIAFSCMAQDIEVPQTQRSLITKRTATWCTICGGNAWDIMQGFVSNHSNNAIILNAHHSSSSAFHSTTAKELVDNLEQSFGQPSFFLNNELIGSGNSSTQSTINSGVTANAGQSPVAQVGLEGFLTPGTTEVEIFTKTEFFENANGEYYVSVWPAIKNITAYQANRGENAPHKQILLEAISSTTFGDQIADGSISSGSTFDQNMTYDLSNFSSENIQLIAIIWKKEGNDYTFVNGNVSNITLNVSSTTNLDASQAQLQVQPNPVLAQASIQLSLNTSFEQAEIQLINTMGQLVQQTDLGQLNQGNISLELERTSLPAGLYFVRFQTEKGQLTQKIILR